MADATLTPAERAWHVLERCTTPDGLLASPQERDNYRRVWARDAVVAGFAGVLGGHDALTAGLRASVHTLWQHQAANGQIPSNVGLGEKAEVSFGSLAGRVDATTWWIVGVCLSLQAEPDEALRQQLAEPVDRAFALLKAWEMNQRGLMYTPLGGNWADEYICQGYVLYDQCLRLWALRLAARIFDQSRYAAEAETLTELLKTNFYVGETGSAPYHPTAYAKADAKPYFWFQLGPQGYDTRWDMAANALVLLLDLHPEPARVEAYLHTLGEETGSWLLPAFYPVIQPGDAEWTLLECNYSYSFKNRPYHFHNGGCWPVWMGLLALGLRKHGLTEALTRMEAAVCEALEAEQPACQFHEYWSGDTHEPGGVHPLGYTAAGYRMLVAALGKPDLNTLFA